ncbi:MAG: DUF4062 domain-containing protein [Planctomycetota bacterium]|jgi:hypothetical protein
MSYSANVYNAMIASPGDVAKEKQLAREVILEWNDLHSEQTKIVLLPISWETHSSPELGDRPQAIINKQVLKDADLLIGIFWTRIGTPTGKAESGTLEEIQEHVKADKPTMIYFSNQPVLPDSIDQEQYAKLKDFKESMQEKGLYHEYDTLAKFKDDLYRHLVMTINKNSYFKKQAEATDILLSSNSFTKSEAHNPQISDEAKQLLHEASLDPNGQILKIRYMGGAAIQTNGKNLVPEKNPRALARWEHALEELLENDFVEERGRKGEVFAVTHTGYSYADNLKKGNMTKENSNKSENYSKEELAVIELIAQNGEGEVSAIEKHLSQKHNSLRIDAEAAISSLAHSKIIRQSRTSPICYKLSPEGSIWASKNKHLWLDEIN